MCDENVATSFCTHPGLHLPQSFKALPTTRVSYPPSPNLNSQHYLSPIIQFFHLLFPFSISNLLFIVDNFALWHNTFVLIVCPIGWPRSLVLTVANLFVYTKPRLLNFYPQSTSFHSACPLDPKHQPFCQSLPASLVVGGHHNRHVHQSSHSCCASGHQHGFGCRHAHHLCRWSQVLLLQWNTVLHQRQAISNSIGAYL